jgi:hypothetical protein
MRWRTPQPRKRKHRVGLGVLLAAGLWSAVPGIMAEVDEAELAAAYVFKFSKFVKWPERALPPTDAPLVLCVYGRTPTGSALDRLDDKSAQGHQVRVQRRARGDSLAACHVVYIGDSERPYLPALLRALSGRPTLTVSEIPGFIAAGGMIGLVRKNNRLRFEVNTASAQAADLSISSQLLKLATRVVQE